MALVVGQADELLHLVQDAFAARITVRGDTIVLEGDPIEVQSLTALFSDLIKVAEARRGAHAGLRAPRHRSSDARAEFSPDRPARRHPAHVPRTCHPSEDRRPEALRGRHPRAHRHLRHRPGRHRQDLPRHGHGRGRAQAQGGRAHHPHASRGGGGGEPGLSARHAHREGGPLHPPALRRALRHDRHGARAASSSKAASSRSRRSPSCAGAP